MYTDARTHRIHRHASFFFFCLKKKTTKTTQPSQLRLKGNCSGDKLFGMVKVLPVRTQGPASVLLHRPPGHGDPLELGFPSRGESCSSLSLLEVQRAGGQAALPASPCRSSSSTPAISFSFSCPLRPSRRTLVSLPQEEGLPLPRGCCMGWGDRQVSGWV